MTNSSYVNSAKTHWKKLIQHAISTLVFSALVSACGGGYSGGSLSSQPRTPPEPEPIPQSAPTPVVFPSPLAADVPRRKMEFLDRGLVVIPGVLGNAVSWRLLGNDPVNLVFDVYRNGEKLNARPIERATFYQDLSGDSDDVYRVSALVDGVEQFTSKDATPWASAFLSVPLVKPGNGVVDGEEYSYSANDATVVDLDGDGRYEIILKWDPSNSQDNAFGGKTGNVLLDAYTLEGKQLWRINLGPNIRAGAHYTQFIAYDFDGDGRAEVAMKTADGTVDGRGTVIGDPDVIYRSREGYILEGPEFLSMFDGLSGEVLDTIPYNPPRGNVSDWGDSYGNRVDRFLAGMGYFGGENPSLFMSRGYYTRVLIAAYDWVDEKLVERWVFDTDNGDGSEALMGQGAHSLTVGDVDYDGKDEIIFGAGAVDDDGTLLYSTGLGHGDALHLGDLDPLREGLEVFMVHETPSEYVGEDFDRGIEMHDAATGEILWENSGANADVGRGVSLDIDPRFPGNESWGTRGVLNAADGTEASAVLPSPRNFALYWDGDLSRELLDGTEITKWGYITETDKLLLDSRSIGAVSNNGSKATPVLSADLFGDWREEVIWRSVDNTRLLIYSTPIKTDTRIHTLMHDSQYRTAIAWQNVAYNQPPHTSFFIGYDMQPRGQAPVTFASEEWARLTARGSDTGIELGVYTHGFSTAGFAIYRDTDADPEGRTQIALLEGDAELAGSSRFFVDQNTPENTNQVEPDVTYYYWVEMLESTASTALEFNSSSASLTTTLLPTYSANAYRLGTGIQLNWTTQNIDIESISIYRADSAGPEEAPNFDARVLVNNPDVAASNWLDETTLNNSAYYYWLEFDDGETVFSADPVFAVSELNPLESLTAEVNENGFIEVNWKVYDQYQFPIVSVEVYRNIQNNNTERVRVLPGASTEGTFVDRQGESASPAIPGVTYWYTLKVQIRNSDTPDANPISVSGIPLVPEGGVVMPGEPDPEITLSATKVDEGAPQVNLEWTYSGVQVASIEIFRDTREDGATRESIAADLGAGVLSYIDTTIAAEGDYYYWVELHAPDGEVYEGPIALALGPPATNLLAVMKGNNIEISWDIQNFPKEITSVQLYRHDENAINGRRDRLSPSVSLKGSFEDNGTFVPNEPFEVGKTYWFMFKLTLVDGEEVNTEPEAGIIYAPEPGTEPNGDSPATNLMTVMNGSNIEISWDIQNFPGEITSAELYRNDQGNPNGRTKLAGVSLTGQNFVDDGSQDPEKPFVVGQTYWYMFKLTIDGEVTNTDAEAEIIYLPEEADPDPDA